MGVSMDDLDNWFSYHPPRDGADIEAYQTVREAGKEFARVILQLTPVNADQTTAIRAVRNAVMWANASRACGDQSITPQPPVPLPETYTGEPVREPQSRLPVVEPENEGQCSYVFLSGERCELLVRDHEGFPHTPPAGVGG